MKRGLGIRNYRSVGGFDPLSLFAGGINGAWYDPSDATTLFSDRAGTTPCATPGAGAVVPVGRMLDKSGNGNHAIAANDTTARPELSARVNLLLNTDTLSTQSVTTQATSYTLRFTGTGSIALSGTGSGTYSAGSNSVTCTAGTLTLTVSGTVTNADLRPTNIGSQIPAYQRVADQYTYDSTGFPRYLYFDGIDDRMTAAVDLSGTNKATAFLSLRKLSDSLYRVPFAQFVSPVGSGPYFSILAPYNNNEANYAAQSRGTSTNNQVGALTRPAPRTDVLTLQTDIGAPSLSLRTNGTSYISSTASQGTGNFGNGTLQLSDTGPGGLWLGPIYSLILVGSAVSAGSISSTETWVNGKTGGVY